jgi:hypothetical protein
MRWLAVSMLLVALAAPVLAQVTTGNCQVLPPKGGGDGASDGREGGESYADAIVITYLTYTDTGATCDNVDDVTPSCAFSNAPDVVYAFTPPTDVAVSVDLCGSSYDTILEVQDGIGVPIACNDDYCGVQSGIDFVPLTAGHTYYFIVDGYDTSCGSYVFNLVVYGPTCQLECPEGGLQEGEPECGDGYVDSYNGGCNSTPHVFQPVWGSEEGTAVLCGKSGTYHYLDWEYRDTDWYEVFGTGLPLEATLIGEFDVQLILIYGADCDDLQYILVTAPGCESCALSHVVDSGAKAWIWAGPAGYTGVPCGADYLLELTGITPGVISPVGQPPSWGEIKRCFR